MEIIRLLIIYLVCINIYTYILFFVDKKRSKKEKRRVSEKELLNLSLFGGVIGALLAMKKFRHKTKKKSFYYRIYAIIIIQIILIGMMIKYLI